MSTDKTAKVSTKSTKKGLASVGDVNAVQEAREMRTELVRRAAKLAIDLHRDALKELERY